MRDYFHSARKAGRSGQFCDVMMMSGGRGLAHVGTQTRTRSDRTYCIPEGARRAIINYLSRYKTLRISVRACPLAKGKPGTVGQEVATMNNHAPL